MPNKVYIQGSPEGDDGFICIETDETLEDQFGYDFKDYRHTLYIKNNNEEEVYESCFTDAQLLEFAQGLFKYCMKYN